MNFRYYRSHYVIIHFLFSTHNNLSSWVPLKTIKQYLKFIAIYKSANINKTVNSQPTRSPLSVDLSRRIQLITAFYFIHSFHLLLELYKLMKGVGIVSIDERVYTQLKLIRQVLIGWINNNNYSDNSQLFAGIAEFAPVGKTVFIVQTAALLKTMDFRHGVY